MLDRLIWEAKMCALTSALQRAIRTAIDADQLSAESVLQAAMIQAVTYARTTAGLTEHDIERAYREALRAVPAAHQAPMSGVVLV
jgi:hypothetical protein